MQTTADTPTLPARQKILLAAHDLFYRDGVRATGVDKVIAQAHVTKVTFYRHFPSKNDLVLAFLEYRHQLWLSWFRAALRRHGGAPGGGLRPLLPALAEWFSQPEFRGCAFINIAAEISDEAEYMTLCRCHKQDMLAVIGELPALTCPNRAAIAAAAGVAVDGSIVKTQIDGDAHAALSALALILDGLDALASAGNRFSPSDQRL